MSDNWPYVSNKFISRASITAAIYSRADQIDKTGVHFVGSNNFTTSVAIAVQEILDKTSPIIIVLEFNNGYKEEIPVCDFKISVDILEDLKANVAENQKTMSSQNVKQQT